jgi:hypothetical protein
MANRTTATAVKVILDTDLTDAQITAFITTANALVDDQLLNKGLSSTILTEIEKWLAAHLASIRDQRVSRESIGDEYSATYQGKTDMGLEATLYGQTALALDTTGTLRSTKLKVADFEVYTTPDHNTGSTRLVS